MESAQGRTEGSRTCARSEELIELTYQCLADQATRIKKKEVVRETRSFVADDGSTEYGSR